MANLSNINNKFLVTTGGNVGINATSPTSKIDVREDANNVYTGYFYNSSTASNAHGINVQTATTNADAYAFRVNSGSNTNALVVKGDANVGIGTASPASVLHIKDNSAGPTQLSIQSNDFTRAEEINFLNPSTSAISGQIKYYTNPTVEYMSFSTSNNSAAVERIRISNTLITVPTITELRGDIAAKFAIGNMGGASSQMMVTSRGFLTFNVSNTGSGLDATERMRITSAGNVGIGTAGYAQKRLDVSGPTGAQVLITGDSDDVGTTAGIMFRSEASEENGLARVKGGIFFERIAGSFGNGKLKFAVNGSVNNDTVAVTDVAMTIDNNKNVGINKTSPGYKLHVRGGSATEETVLKIDKTATADSGGHTTILGFGTESGDWAKAGIGFERTGSYDVGKMHFLMYPTGLNTNTVTLAQSVMTINNNANVGIGTTSPDNILHIETSNAGGPQIQLESTSGTASAAFINFDSTSLQLSTQRDMVDGDWYDTSKSWGGINIQGPAGGSFITFQTAAASNTSPTERIRIKADGNILVADTRRIQFNNTDQYIGASSTNDLEIVAGDDINLRSNFSRFFSGAAEHARLTGVGGTSWVVNGSATHKFGVGITNPQDKLHVNGNAIISSTRFSDYSNASIDTTGFVIANVPSSTNGQSVLVEFVASGGSAAYYNVVYTCYNGAGNWYYTKRVVGSAGNIEVAETNGSGSSTLVFYFRTTSGTSGYTPRVMMKATPYGLITF